MCITYDTVNRAYLDVQNRHGEYFNIFFFLHIGILTVHGKYRQESICIHTIRIGKIRLVVKYKSNQI